MRREVTFLSRPQDGDAASAEAGKHAGRMQSSERDTEAHDKTQDAHKRLQRMKAAGSQAGMHQSSRHTPERLWVGGGGRSMGDRGGCPPGGEFPPSTVCCIAGMQLELSAGGVGGWGERTPALLPTRLGRERGRCWVRFCGVARTHSVSAASSCPG